MSHNMHRVNDRVIPGPGDRITMTTEADPEGKASIVPLQLV